MIFVSFGVNIRSLVTHMKNPKLTKYDWSFYLMLCVIKLQFRIDLAQADFTFYPYALSNQNLLFL